MAKIEAIDTEGNAITLTGVDLSQGVNISDISSTEEWALKSIDDTPKTYVTDFAGGRPDDR